MKRFKNLQRIFIKISFNTLSDLRIFERSLKNMSASTFFTLNTIWLKLVFD
jgi:hypothetical protein